MKRKILFGPRMGVLVSMFVILSAINVSHAAIPAAERTALLDLYTSTNGASWSSNQGWNGDSGTECSWVGVTCDSVQAHVTALNLAQNNLSGVLPDLGGLPNLQSISVYANQLSGSLPNLDGFTELTYLNVSSNRLTGSLPSLSALAHLTFFDASANLLTGSIPGLSNLASLQFFNVQQNQLQGALPSLSGLAQLQAFYANNNHLSGTIPALAGLQQLQYFGSGGNQLAGALPSLSGLSAMKGFDVDNNQLTGSIPDLSGLTALNYLFVNNNQLSGSIPALASLVNLAAVNVSGNQLNGNIPALASLQKLVNFDASGNQLSGAVPDLAGLNNLQVLKVSNNLLSGSLPSLSGLGHLTEIDVDGNTLSGDLPDPSTTVLAAGRSVLCPNSFNTKANSIWDYATGISPWYSVCSSFMNLDQHGLTGSWYNASTSGQGFVLEVYPELGGAGHGVLAGGWFTYSANLSQPSGKNWFTIQGGISNSSPYARLGVYYTGGGSFNVPPKVSARQVGNATLVFIDCTHAQLHYSISLNPLSPQEGVIPLSRLDNNVTCTQQGDSGADPSNFLLSGAWYDPNTSGQGLFFDINPTQQILFAAWYTFPSAGTSLAGDTGQRWFTLQAPFTPGTNPLNQVPIYSASGGYFDHTDAVTTTQVGSATLSINSCTSLTLAYTFTDGELKGQGGTINLQRVGPTPANCKL